MEAETPKAEAPKEDVIHFPKYNLVIWILDKENDIVPWFSLDNPRLKSIPIPKPDFNIRKVVIEILSKVAYGYKTVPEEKREDLILDFVDQTNGLFANEIVSIVSLSRKEKIEFLKISDAIKRYKLGITENPWGKINKKKVQEAENNISTRVKGQKHAIRKTADIIKRGIYNLSSAHASKSSGKPKGVLFFAGPTGVGKTELAKTITELLFGSENSCIRFDMSEFSHEHSDQRLLGAPPGYAGYDVGGELTSAVQQNPFSVILFDEIEKCNKKILDIFLQILDDGAPDFRAWRDGILFRNIDYIHQ